MKNKYSLLDIASLTDKCVENDPLAWSEFISRFNILAHRSIKKRLERHGFSFTKEDLEDLKQGFFIKLWQEKSITKVKGAYNINYWLCMVAANFTTDFVRKSKKDPLKNSSSLFEELTAEHSKVSLEKFLASPNKDIRTEIDREDYKEKINRTMSDLNHKEKIALQLNIFHGMKYTEIAGILKLSVGNLSSVLNRAKVKIKKKMQENT